MLTRDVGVAPGSRCEGLANLAFNWCSFTLDCGYNFFAKEAECVTVKCWQDDTFGVAASGYNPANDFSAGSIDDGRFVDPIQRENLLPQLAATPAYVTHKALIGMSYGFNKWEYPFMVGLGGSWEWVQGGNSALNGYNLWLKAGMTF